MTTSLHVLHVLDHSIPLHSGYAFRTRAILDAQRALGWKTSHLTSSKQKPSGKAEERVDGLLFYRTPMVSPWLDRTPLVNQFAVVEYLARRLVEVCEKEQPDIIHAHSPCLTGIAALKVAPRLGLPVVYEMRAPWEDAATHHRTTKAGSFRYKASRYLETCVLRKAAAVTTICEGLREEIASRGIDHERITVIPNAVDAERFVEPQRNLALARRMRLDGQLVLGFAGSFYAYEGLSLLLTALPIIRREEPRVRLLLVGGGPEEGRLKALSERLGVSDVVVFSGRVPHSDIGAYYGLVDIFVYPRVPSRLTELVTPLKPLEAMAQRRIVLASDVGGHRELIRDGETGVLFSAGDPNRLAEAVLRTLRDSDQWPAMRDAGRLYVERERTWKSSVAGYSDVYHRLLGDTAHR